ncbi:histone RNA hairpin-binding protein [Rhagoletis pomonella]|uniref:histone RNA hairpin-binding protein n=1 Tax=Rhagoletis pomonella TaxID=28610 RepID=UPI00177C50B5|nr:histone RNA hairpin-binding protein [Rhagoletis pomonella]
MLCSKMSGDRSPLRKSTAGCSLNSSASSIVSFHGSWAQEMRNAEKDGSGRKSLDSSAELPCNNSLGNSSNDVIQNQESMDSKPATSQDREISLKFIEGVNEEKFERLLKEDKLKTPFKRRYSQTPSNDSRSDSPNDSNSDNGGSDEKGVNGHNTFKCTSNQSKYQYDLQKRLRYNSYGSSTSKEQQVENDPAILARRQKQIEYGKNTVAYERYIEMVPIRKRNRSHPRTPDKYGKYSRRTFDGLIKVWRKQLHYYDPEPAAGTANGGADDDDDDSD